MWAELLRSVVDGDFGGELRECLKKLGLTVKEFSELSNIPSSTLYKIVTGATKDFGVTTLKKIVQTVREIEGFGEKDVIGIITSRTALDTIDRTIKIGDREFTIKEYPAVSIEEEIIQGIRAERDGVKGLICGPIAATTLQKVVSIPIIALRFEEGPLYSAIRRLAEKLAL